MQLSQVSSSDLFIPNSSTFLQRNLLGINLSDDENSIKVTSSSSKGSDSDFSDSDKLVVNNHKDTYDFQFDPNHSEIQIYEPESTLYNLLLNYFVKFGQMRYFN